jgi:hypothetical protein
MNDSAIRIRWANRRYVRNEVEREVWDEVLRITNEHLDGPAHFGYVLRDKLVEAASKGDQ